jgi:hypothetical protein
VTTASIGIRASKPQGGGGGGWPPPVDPAPPAGVPAGAYIITSNDYWEHEYTNNNQMKDPVYDAGTNSWFFEKQDEIGGMPVDPCARVDSACLSYLRSMPILTSNLIGDWDIYVEITLTRLSCSSEFDFPECYIGFAKYNGDYPSGTFEAEYWDLVVSGPGTYRGVYNDIDFQSTPFTGLVDTDFGTSVGNVTIPASGNKLLLGTAQIQDGMNVTISGIWAVDQN